VTLAERMPEFNEGPVVKQGAGAGEGRTRSRGLATQFLFVRRCLVSFEGEMDATTGQTTIATEAQMCPQMHNAYSS